MSEILLIDDDPGLAEPLREYFARFNLDLHAEQHPRDTLDEAVARGEIAPLDTEATAAAMLAYLEGIILLAKARNEPEIVQVLGPAIKTLRIEHMN